MPNALAVDPDADASALTSRAKPCTFWSRSRACPDVCLITASRSGCESMPAGSPPPNSHSSIGTAFLPCAPKHRHGRSGYRSFMPYFSSKNCWTLFCWPWWSNMYSLALISLRLRSLRAGRGPEPFW